MLKFGLKHGDKIISINDKATKYFDDIPADVITSDRIKVLRNGKEELLIMPPDLIGQLVELKKKGIGFLELRRPAIVGDMSDKYFDTLPAKIAGLQHFDKIISIDSTPVQFFDEIGVIVQQKKNSTVQIEVQRNSEKKTLISKVSGDGKLGLPYIDIDEMDSLKLLKIQEKKYGFFAAFPAGVAKAGEKLSSYYNQFKKIVNPKTGGYKAVGGFKSMGSIFPTPWNWEAFWSITAFLSIMLAFMNLLPIPALDGGHVLFTLGEMITGRKPSEKFLEYAQIVGFVILLALMLYANGNDLFGWGKGK